jgi:hypothetical protein
MAFSKDGDGGETNSLSVVGGSGTQSASGGDAPSPSDRSSAIKLAQLKQEHRDLDEAIQALIASGRPDQLQLTRLKKRKLMLRDMIASLEDDILPDIIA